MDLHLLMSISRYYNYKKYYSGNVYRASISSEVALFCSHLGSTPSCSSILLVEELTACADNWQTTQTVKYTARNTFPLGDAQGRCVWFKVGLFFLTSCSEAVTERCELMCCCSRLFYSARSTTGTF